MHLFLEITFTVLALVFAVGMLVAAFRPVIRDLDVLLRCALALTAWFPVWLFTKMLWHLCVNPVSLGYPWWFWLVLAIGVVMTLASFIPGVRLLPFVRITGILLVVLAFVEMVTPAQWDWHWSSDWLSWSTFWTLLVLGVVCVVIALLVRLALVKLLAKLIGFVLLLAAVLVLGLGLANGNMTLGGTHNHDNVAKQSASAITVSAPSYAANNLSVSFIASATGPSGDTLGYRWNFGDGATGEGTRTTHAYTTSGTYQVTVTVSDMTHPSVAAASQTVSLTVTKPETVTKQVGLNTKQLAKQLGHIYKGFKPGQVKAGTGHIPDSTREAATLSFSGKTLATPADLAQFLRSDNRLAKQTQQRIRAALHHAGYGHKEVQRALGSADHWFWVAPTVSSQISGTTYPIGGKVVQENGFRSVAPNDAMWFYVTSDGKVVKGASVRADCGNGDVNVITPIPPGSTPPSIACVTDCGHSVTPTCHVDCTKTPTCTTNCQPKKCDCVTPTQAQQPVPTPAKAPTGTPTKAPTKNPVGPKPVQGSPAPDPTPGGYDSGSGDGSGTPGGTTCDGSGCQGGGSSPGQGDGGAGTGSTSGDTNTGVVTGP